MICTIFFATEIKGFDASSPADRQVALLLTLPSHSETGLTKGLSPLSRKRKRNIEMVPSSESALMSKRLTSGDPEEQWAIR